MKQSRLITWLVFFVGVVAVGDVLAWISWRLITLERQQEHSRAEAARQEAIGRALWRMDSIVLPLLAVESARPYWEYQAFYPANRAADQMWLAPEPDDVLVPSPLLGETGDLVRLHFERDHAGRLTSPQVPTGQGRAHAVAVGIPETLLEQADLRLYELDRLSTLDREVAGAAPSMADSVGLILDAHEIPTVRRLDESPIHHNSTFFLQSGTPQSPELDATIGLLAPEGQPSPADSARSSEPDTSLEQAPASSPAPESNKEATLSAPPDVRQDYSARQQANLNAQTYNDPGRASRGRALEPRAAEPTTPPVDTTPAAPALATNEPQNSVSRDRLGGGGPAQVHPPDQRAQETPTPNGPVLRERERAVDRAERESLRASVTTSERPADESAAEDDLAPLPADTLTSPLVAPDNNLDIVPVTTPLVPLWRGPGTPGGESALVLVRHATVAGQSREQGVWIDWPALRRDLEASVADLFPLAEVRPVWVASPDIAAPETQRLATLPVVLIPGPLAAGILPPSPGFWTPTRWTLLVGWIAVAIAVLAIGVVLRKAIDLGERRGRFVSAVTHELRTPLTTFRLYSQMLASNSITDESKRQRYAQTLDRESQRLSGIVESVLEYARLGRRASSLPARQRLSVAALIDRVRPALTGRAERAGMDLVLPDPAPEATIVADPDRVERVLLNLVDNACKYAAEADDRRILLDAALRDGRLILGVRDFGPGVPPAEQRRIFNAFHRAKHHDASASPGLGLGLALSRGLAREMGGDLRLTVDVSPGARFELSIPAD